MLAVCLSVYRHSYRRFHKRSLSLRHIEGSHFHHPTVVEGENAAEHTKNSEDLSSGRHAQCGKWKSTTALRQGFLLYPCPCSRAAIDWPSTTYRCSVHATTLGVLSDEDFRSTRFNESLIHLTYCIIRRPAVYMEREGPSETFWSDMPLTTSFLRTPTILTMAMEIAATLRARLVRLCHHIQSVSSLASRRRHRAQALPI